MPQKPSHKEKTEARCPCKWVRCPRHGDCPRCIAHHRGHPKHQTPFCQRPSGGKKRGTAP